MGRTQDIVVVVGGAGFVGRALCAALVGQGARVVVVDRARSSSDALDIDIAAPEARDALARACDGARSIVHLAARVDPPASPRERDEMRRLHTDGTAAVVAAAERAGAKIVLASSAVVYGARALNRVPLDERAPVAPNDFAYAVDKAEQECIVDAARVPRAVARPAIVYGAGARNYLTEIIRRAPFLPAVDGRRPQLQFVHVDDVARALAFLALSSHTGAFNVAPADWLALEDVAALAHKRVVDVPLALVAPVIDRLVRFMPPHLRAPAAMLPYLMFPFVVSAKKLAAAGCAPRFTSADAVRAMLAG